MRKSHSRLHYAVSLIIAIMGLYLFPDTVDGAVMTGLLALFYNALTVYEVKENNKLLILFSIIMYINLSAFVLGPLTEGTVFAAYQSFLWKSSYNAIAMKCIMISSCMFYLVMDRQKKNKQIDDAELFRQGGNFIITYACLVVNFLICLFSFGGSADGGEYVSNQNPLFEYAIFFFIIAWCYIGRATVNKIAWILCAAFYILIALYGGDRSSAFMLLLVIAIYYMKNIGIVKTLSFCFLGITFSNFIASYRYGGLSSNYTIFHHGLTSIFSDTAAQSYYTGVTIYYYLDHVRNHFELFSSWLLSLFTGSVFVDRKSIELSLLANYYNYNGGGGFFQSYFYLFNGYLGVALGSFLAGKIIFYVFQSKNQFSLLLQYAIPAMVFRWYLYTPTTFFRACLLNFGIIYLAAKIFNSMTKNR